MKKHQGHGVVVDTNLLLLYLVGELESALIPNFKPLRSLGLGIPEYHTLCRLLRHFPNRLLTTPHILAEVSNHAEKLKGSHQRALFVSLAATFGCLDERHEGARLIATDESFTGYGLTDAAISRLSTQRYLVVTIDFPLAGHLEKRGVAVLNFNHLRHSCW